MAWRTTPENRHGVIERFLHRSKAEAKVVAAELQPAEAPPRRDIVTTVSLLPFRMTVSAPPPAALVAAPTTAASQAVLPANQSFGGVGLDEHPATTAADDARGRPSPPPVRRDGAEPLTADLLRLHVTVSRRFLDKLAAARDALSHSQPGATTEAVLEAALDLLLDRDAKRKALVKNPRPAPSRPSGSARHIPADVKRAVWQRDGGRCVWPVSSGGACGSTTRLELDHVVPVSRGGPSTVENLRIACAFHNRLAAQRLFGEERMEGAVENARARHQSRRAQPGSTES